MKTCVTKLAIAGSWAPGDSQLLNKQSPVRNIKFTKRISTTELWFITMIKDYLKKNIYRLFSMREYFRLSK